MIIKLNISINDGKNIASYNGVVDNATEELKTYLFGMTDQFEDLVEKDPQANLRQYEGKPIGKVNGEDIYLEDFDENGLLEMQDCDAILRINKKGGISISKANGCNISMNTNNGFSNINISGKGKRSIFSSLNSNSSIQIGDSNVIGDEGNTITGEEADRIINEVHQIIQRAMKGIDVFATDGKFVNNSPAGQLVVKKNKIVKNSPAGQTVIKR